MKRKTGFCNKEVVDKKTHMVNCGGAGGGAKGEWAAAHGAKLGSSNFCYNFIFTSNEKRGEPDHLGVCCETLRRTIGSLDRWIA